MGFLQNLIKPKAPKPEPLPVISIPSPLPKIAATRAAEICNACEPKPAAQALLTTQQTPTQYLAALQEKQLGEDMIKALAHGLADREGVWWAVACAQKLSAILPSADVQALRAAEAWVKSPTESNRAAAGAAAAKTDYCGPGAWAAQGAAWSSSKNTPPAPSGEEPAPRLTPNAVVGAVLVSAAISANPALAAPKPPAPITPLPSLAAPQMPKIAAPTLAPPGVSLPVVSAPQLPGAMPAVPQPGMPAFQAPALKMPSPGISAPAVPGMKVSQPNIAVPTAPQVALPAVSAPSASPPALQVPKLALPSPALPPPEPVVPPAVQEKTFREQHAFIALGIDIAAGKNSWA